MNAPSTDKIPLPTPRTDANSLLRSFAISLFIMAFDFRAQLGRSADAFQGILLLIYILCFLHIVVAATKRSSGIGPMWVLVLAILVFMIESSAVGLIHGQPARSIFTNLIPLFLYTSAGASTYLVLSVSKNDTESLLQILRWASLVTCVAHLAVIILARGSISVSTARYEVLSGAIIPSLGIIAVGLTQKLSRLDIAVVLTNLSVALLSVTRILIIVLAVQVALVILARPSVVFRRATRKGLALVSILVLSVVALDFAAGTGLTARWTSRLTLSNKLGADPSALLRLAETHYMWNHFTASAEQLILGNGLAAVTSAVGREDVLVASLVGRGSAQIHMVGFGHQNHVSILFVAGLLGGGGLLILQCLNAVQSFALFRRLQLWPLLYRQSDARIGMWGGLTVVGMLTYGFGAGTFGDRDTSLWFGVGTGMLYWARGLQQQTHGSGELRTGQSVGVQPL